MINDLEGRIPVGNIPCCILEGCKNNSFDLTDNPDKLRKHDGIIWKDDLCLRKEPLIRFVRPQFGYQKWSSNKIIRTLNDIGALVLQEENAYTVRLKKTDAPRVHRIRMKVLEENAKKF